jgi:hypothetical protein
VSVPHVRVGVGTRFIYDGELVGIVEMRYDRQATMWCSARRRASGASSTSRSGNFSPANARE